MEPNNTTPNLNTNNTQSEQDTKSHMAVADTILEVQKSNNKGSSPLIKIVAAALSILLLAGGVWLGLSLNKDDTKSNNTSNDATNQQTETTMHPISSIVKEATDTVKTSGKDVVVMTNSGDTNAVLNIYDSASKRYLAVNAKDKESATIELMNDQDKTTILDSIVSSIKKHDFSDYSTANWPADYQSITEQSGERESWLKGGSYYCNAYTTSLPSVEVACVSSEQISANANETKPFYDAAETNEGSIVMVNMSTLKKSTKYPTYEYVSGGIGEIAGAGAGAYWYRNNGGTWVFGYAAQDLPECSSFDTVDMQKAFYDQSCYDAANATKETTVGAYYKL